MAKRPVVNMKAKMSALQERMVSLTETSLLTRQSLLNLMTTERKNIDFECGYPDSISPEEYRRAYDRGGIPHRVVELYPDETWKVKPEVYETKDPSQTAFESAWEMLVKSMNLWFYLHQVDELSGIGRFGTLLLGFDDGGELETPVPGIDENGRKVGSRPTRLLYLQSFDESQVRVMNRQTDKRSPRFGQPTYYHVIFQDVEATATTTSVQPQRVHWSRMVHIADNRMAGSQVFGVPRLQVVWNRAAIDAKKVVGGAAEMFWKGAFPGISLEMAPGLTDTDIDQDAIKETVENYQNTLQRYLLLFGMSAKSLAPQIADPTAQYDIILNDIAIACGCPLRIFRGSEQAQLASGQDKSTWNERLTQRDTDYVAPMLVRPIVDRLIRVGVLPEPKKIDVDTYDYTVEFPDRNTPTAQDKAQVALTITQALRAYVEGGVDQVIPPDLYMTHVLKMDPEEVKVILEAAAEYVSELEDPNDQNPQVSGDEGIPQGNRQRRPTVTGNAQGGVPETPRMESPRVEIHLKDERTLTMPKIENHIAAQPVPTVVNSFTVPAAPTPVLPSPVVQITNEVHPSPVSPPSVNVEVHPSAPPQVRNEITVAPAPVVPQILNEIHVSPTPIENKVNVTVPEPKARAIKVERDSDGKITGATSTPTPGKG